MRRQECCGYWENCTTVGLRLARLGGSLSLRYVKQVSGKRQDHRFEKYKSNFLISEVRPYAMKFEDWSHEVAERLQRCAQSTAWNLARNICKLKENDQVTFYSFAEELGTLRCVNKRAGGKSLWWILEVVCIWSVRKTLTG